jgi:hypothetical protein
MPLVFDLPGWRPAAFGGEAEEAVKVLMKGTVRTTAGVEIPDAPLLVKFPFKKGTVLFTSFHNEKVNGVLETKLLNYLVFSTITARSETDLNTTMVSGGFSPQPIGILTPRADNPSIDGDYENKQARDLRFALGFDRPGARLSLEVTGPEGQHFAGRGEKTFTIDVPSATAGRWHYAIVAERVPFANYPFNLVVGARFPAPVSASPDGGPGKSGARPIGGRVTFGEIALDAPRLPVRRRIGVTPPLYDDMGKLLDALGEGFRYETLTMEDLRELATLKGFDIIFLTCSGMPDAWFGKTEGATNRPGMSYGQIRPEIANSVFRNLRQFLDEGGTLYVSDLCYQMVEGALPEFVSWSDAEIEMRLRVLRELDDEEQGLLLLLNPASNIDSVSRTLQKAGLSPGLADKVDLIALAVVASDLAWKGSLREESIDEVVRDLKLPVGSDDVHAITLALRNRAAKINRLAPGRNTARAKQRAAQEHNERIDRLRKLIASQVISEGAKQSLQATVVDVGLRDLLGGPTLNLMFDLDGWQPAYFAGPGVTVLLRGRYRAMSGQEGEAPLLVKLPVGRGTLVFTSFHNEKVNSAVETKLLRYLVFTAVTAQVEALVNKTVMSGGFSAASTHTSGDPSATQTYQKQEPGRLRFALSFAGEGARLKLTIVAPNGQAYEKVTPTPLVVEVPDAPAGKWRYTVTAEQVPYKHFPFNVTIGEGAAKRDP